MGHDSQVPALTREAALEWVEPAYPDWARDRELEGTVTMLLDLDAHGRVQAFHFLSGPIVFQDSIRGVARRWRFSPRKRNGTPVQSTVRFLVAFQLL